MNEIPLYLEIPLAVFLAVACIAIVTIAIAIWRDSR